MYLCLEKKRTERLLKVTHLGSFPRNSLFHVAASGSRYPNGFLANSFLHFGSPGTTGILFPIKLETGILCIIPDFLGCLKIVLRTNISVSSGLGLRIWTKYRLNNLGRRLYYNRRTVPPVSFFLQNLGLVQFGYIFPI